MIGLGKFCLSENLVARVKVLTMLALGASVVQQLGQYPTSLSAKWLWDFRVFWGTQIEVVRNA